MDAIGTVHAHDGDHHHHTHTKAAGLKVINLALQGGGAHGAFTWGVLDRLLEEARLGFDGISATSAGAMNAAVFAYGLAEGGREGAKRALANFWRRISHAAAFSPLQPTALDRMLGNKSLEWSPSFIAFDMLSRLLSPYQFNPLNYNPLRDVIAACVDFEKLRTTCCPVKLFLSATNVRTGKVRVFANDEVNVDTVLASACLPFMFHAVEIDGDPYWDGGYMGNPCLYPLIYECESTDVLVVHINPLERKHMPHTAAEILNRINEISFNSSLMREMRAIVFVTKLIDSGELKSPMKRMLMHSIAANEMMNGLGHASKLNADWEFLTGLRDAGRAHADAWIKENFAKLGESSTVDIRATYL
jgi:NTE family protein